MGHTSPEVYAAFPRNMGLTALDAIGTGYEGVFSRRPLSDDQKTRVLYLLEYFKDQLATSRTGTPVAMSVEDLALKNFAHYMPPQQALLIFLRAIVSRSPLLVLDEPTQGMDESIWAKCTELLDKEWNEMSAEGKDQACVVVSHYEDEIPWKYGKVLELVDGRVV
jgi:ABC-type molybdenum transport system ATPase subunit/photorepair protein PhrA